MAGRGQRPKDQARPMFMVNKVPGFAAQMRKETPRARREDASPSGRSQDSSLRSRDSSPKMPRPRSEEIPLEDMRLRKSSLTVNGSASSSDRDEIPVLNLSINSESAVMNKHSEETSFTSPQSQQIKKSRRKGQVETV